MTASEFTTLMEAISGAWPTFKLSDTVMSTWGARIVRVPADDAERAYERLLGSGSAFAPTLAEFLAAVTVVQQGPAPTPEECDAILRANAGKWPYRGHVTAAEHTRGAVAQLTAAGVHEAVCRFVAQIGGREAAEFPDAASGLERDAQIRRHELLRSYRDHAVASWQSDPTPGLALERASRDAGLTTSQGPRKLSTTLAEIGPGS